MRTDLNDKNMEVIKEHDVSDLVGFRVRVRNAARKFSDGRGQEWIEIPEQQEMTAAAAMVRCLIGFKLRGSELRAIRHIVGWTAEDLAKKLDARASSETVSRWENQKQQMGGYAEKVFRLNVCEALKNRAPGVDYDAGKIAHLEMIDPWIADENYEIPYVVLDWVRMKNEDRKITETYTDDLPKAA